MDTSYGSSYDVISINIAQTDWGVSDLRGRSHLRMMRKTEYVLSSICMHMYMHFMRLWCHRGRMDPYVSIQASRFR